jgi:hypothetical protein
MHHRRCHHAYIATEKFLTLHGHHRSSRLLATDCYHVFMSFFHSFALMIGLYVVLAPPIMGAIYRYARFLREED